MIRPVTEGERARMNLEDPSARTAACMAAENGPWANLRASHVRRLALSAQGRAAYHALHDNAAALRLELDRILEASA